MNIRNLIGKKDDPLAPLPTQRIGRDGTANRRSKGEPVYPGSPTPQDVKQIRNEIEEKPIVRRATVEKDRDWGNTILTVLFGLFAIALIGVGALLSTKAGTPNNLAWIHAENAAIGIMLVLLWVRTR